MLRVIALLMATAAVVAGQSPAPAASQQTPASPPTFRTAANYIRVDLYATRNGVAVEDLKPGDLELREDNVVQQIDAFEYVRVRGAATDAARVEPNTLAESRQMAAEARARVFVIYLDTYHTQFDGAVTIRTPLVKFLDRAIGPDDLVAIMTPELSSRGLTFARKTTVLEGMVQNDLYWAKRGDILTDRKEALYDSCYPPYDRQNRPDDTAAEMRRRRREKLTLDSVNDLISTLGSLREERKAVLMVSEGWLEYRPSDVLSQPQRDAHGQPFLPPPETFGLDPRPNGDGQRPNASMMAECEGDRLALAMLDDRERVQQLTETANRANVTFYSLYARGLAALDAPVGPDRPPAPIQDAANLSTRHQSLRRLAENTDGFAVIDTLNFDPAINRIIADLSSYYLLGYYSTNGKLDGKFRTIRVTVKRPGVDVRARRGYRALRSDVTPATATVAAPASRALAGVSVDDRAPLRVRASAWVERDAQGATAHLWVAGELDARTRRDPDWANGGTGEATIVSRDGSTLATQTITLPAGQGAFSVRLDANGLTAGEYSAQIRLRPAVNRLSPVMGSAPLPVPDGALGDALLFRRGPTTGNKNVATADPRFTRNERMVIEIPGRVAASPTARLLDRAGNPLAIPLQVTERAEPNADWRWIVVDVTLAPLAAGDYGVEVQAADSRRVTEFRIVP